MAILDGLRRLSEGELLAILGSSPRIESDVSTWARLTGFSVVETSRRTNGAIRLVIRKGAAMFPGVVEEEASRRLWLYSNFDCNLTCDYCCVRSGPGADPRWLPLPTIRQLAAEAEGVGFRRILLTGGEPFLRPDIEEILTACTDRLPTTVLTNGSLFSGPKGRVLQNLPRERLTIQVSLDSPEAGRHDEHRGSGSWSRAQEGARTARSLGFPVRIAATIASSEDREEMDRWLENEGYGAKDRLVRPLALRGRASKGMALARSDLVPELTVTGRGVYWHPVGADDEDFFVRADPLPLAESWLAMQELWDEERSMPRNLAEVFHCA